MTFGSLLRFKKPCINTRLFPGFVTFLYVKYHRVICHSDVFIIVTNEIQFDSLQTGEDGITERSSNL